MVKKPTYEKLEQRVKELEKSANARVSLKKQLKLLSVAVEQSSEGIAVIDLDGDLEYLNNAFAEMHGYSVDELVGKNLSVFHTPEQIPSVEAANLEIKQTGNFQGEIWHVKRDGTVFPTLMHNSLVRDDTGKPIGIMGTLRDITDIKQAEVAQRKSEERHRLFFEKSPTGIIHYSNEGIITAVNNAMIAIFGSSSEKLIGLDINDIPDKMFSKEVYKSLNGEPGYYEGEYKSYTGKKTVNIKANWIPIIRNGEIVAGVGIVEDITEQKQAEDLLRASETRYRSLFDNSPVSLWEEDFSRVKEFLDDLTSSGVSDLRAHLEINLDTLAHCARIVEILDVNKATVDLFEVENKDEILGNLKKLFIDRSLKVFQEELITLYEGTGPFRGEIIGRSLKGNQIDCVVEVSIAPEYEDSWSKVLVSVTDITLRKQAEEELRESKERYQGVVEDQTEIISRFYPDNTHTFVNDVYCRFFGKSKEELIGKKWFPNVYQDDVEMIKAKLMTMSPSNPVMIIENRVFSGKGDVHWMQFVNRGFYDHTGNLLEIQAVGRDITELKQAEKALLESEEKYRSMMEAMSEPTYICTSDYRVSYMNPAMIKRTGYDATGELCYKALYGLDEQCPYCVYDKILQGESVETEIDSPKDGRSFQISHAPIFHQNGSTSKITIYRDTTDQKLAQSALIESERELKIKAKDLEELNAALKVLLNKRQEDKEGLEEGILSNVRTLIEPYIVKLKRSKLPQSQKTLLNILESNLNEIVSPFTRKLSSKYLNLTPTQIQVANLVKQGKTNKDISEILHVAGRTIAFHRENIRKKLNLTNKKTNLKTYLMSID